MNPHYRRYDVLVIDDHPLLCEALQNVFERQCECASVAAVRDLRAAVAYLENHSTAVILLSYDPGNDLAFRFLEWSCRAHLRSATIILSLAIHQFASRRLLDLGAAGIISRYTSAAEIAAIVQETAGGATWKSCAALRSGVAAGAMPPALSAMTRRQTAVLNGVMEGWSNKEIASFLGVSETSVKCTMQQIFSKAGVHSRAAVVRVLLESQPGGEGGAGQDTNGKLVKPMLPDRLPARFVSLSADGGDRSPACL